MNCFWDINCFSLLFVSNLWPSSFWYSSLSLPSSLSIILQLSSSLFLSFSLYPFLFLFLSLSISCPVGWGCRIYRLHLCRGIRPPPHPTSVLGWWGSRDTGALGNVEHPFITKAPWSTLARCGSTWCGPMCWLDITKLRTYAKLTCLK